MKEMNRKKRRVKRMKKRRPTHVLGIDQSLRGFAAALVVEHELRDYVFITNLKKLAKNERSIYIPNPKSENDGVRRMKTVGAFLTHLIARWRPDYVAFEDYAFGAQSSSIVSLGELVGVIKFVLTVRGIPFRVYDPKTVKLYATGKGDAEKSDVTSAIENRFEIDLTFASKFSKDKKRKIGEGNDGDIADAITIADMLNTELDVRAGKISVQDLPENERRIFNRVTKKRPDNILFRDFVQTTKGDEINGEPKIKIEIDDE